MQLGSPDSVANCRAGWGAWWARVHRKAKDSVSEEDEKDTLGTSGGGRTSGSRDNDKGSGGGNNEARLRFPEAQYPSYFNTRR